MRTWIWENTPDVTHKCPGAQRNVSMVEQRGGQNRRRPTRRGNFGHGSGSFWYSLSLKLKLRVMENIKTPLYNEGARNLITRTQRRFWEPAELSNIWIAKLKLNGKFLGNGPATRARQPNIWEFVIGADKERRRIFWTWAVSRDKILDDYVSLEL